jgi:hypothetical protein
MNSQNQLLFLCGALIIPAEVISFTVPSSHRSPAFRTHSLNSFVTGSYLETLTPVEQSTAGNFATGNYLNSLSQIADTTQNFDPNSYSPEQFLTDLSNQLFEAASANVPTNFESGGFYVADAELLSPDVLESAASMGDIGDVGGVVDSMAATTTQLSDSISSSVPAVEELVEPINSMSSVDSDSLTLSALPIDSPADIDIDVADAEAVGNSLQEAASDMADSFTSQMSDLSSQLSDLSYGSFVDEKVAKSSSPSFAESLSSKLSGVSYDFSTDSGASAQAESTNKLSEFAANSGASINGAFSSVKEAGVSNFSKLFGQVSKSIEAVPVKISEAGTTSAKVVGKAVELSTAEVANKGAASAQAVEQALQAEKMTIAAGTTSTVKTVGEKSLSDVADGVLAGIKFMGSILVQLLDAILSRFGGSSVGQIIQSTQASITSVIDNATHSVVQTVNDIGNMTMSEVLQNLVGLIIAVSNILLTVLNAVVKLLSGKDASDWALASTHAISDKATELTALASHTAYDLTHKSFTELTASIGDFSNHVGSELVTTIGTLNDAAATDGIDSIATAIQTSFLHL